MRLQIEEGKYYRTRTGEKVGPASCKLYDSAYPWTVGVQFYTDEGWFLADGQESDIDLIAEWVDEPAGLNQMLYGDDPSRVTKKTVLETALQTVADRGVPYGGVEDNFQRIANLWNAHLQNRFDHDEGLHPLGPADVAMMMALMKLARLQGNPSHADSWVDVAGYAACGGEIGAKMAVDKPS